MITIASVNKELKRLGIEERLARDSSQCYFYFYGGDSASWTQSGVYGVRKASDLTIEGWIAEYNQLKAN